MHQLPVALMNFVQVTDVKQTESSADTLAGLGTENFVLRSVPLNDHLLTAAIVVDPSLGIQGTFRLVSEQLKILVSGISRIQNCPENVVKKLTRVLFDGAAFVPAVWTGSDVIEAAMYGEAVAVIVTCDGGLQSEFVGAHFLRSVTCTFRRILGDNLWVIPALGREMDGLDLVGLNGEVFTLKVTAVEGVARARQGGRVHVVQLVNNSTGRLDSAREDKMTFRPLPRVYRDEGSGDAGIRARVDLKKRRVEVLVREGVTAAEQELQMARMSWSIRAVLFGVVEDVARLARTKGIFVEVKGAEFIEIQV